MEPSSSRSHFFIPSCDPRKESGVEQRFRLAAGGGAGARCGCSDQGLEPQCHGLLLSQFSDIIRTWKGVARLLRHPLPGPLHFAQPFPELSAWLDAHPEYELLNKSGLPAHITLNGSPTSYPLFDHGQAAMRAQWLADVTTQVDSGDFDGVFADRAHNLTNWGPEAQLSPAQKSAWQTGHKALLAAAEAAMASVNGTALENNRIAPGVQAAMLEDFGASDACIQALRAAADAGTLVEAHAGDLPGGSDQGCVSITNSLAAFLIGAGRRAYYACSKSWTTNPAWPDAPDAWLDPRSEYDKPLGLPSGPAVLAGGLWARNFSAGVSVTFDVTMGTGRIVWSDGTVQQGEGPADTQASCAWLTD